MLAPPTIVQQTQYRLAQHYLKKLQHASTAMTQPGTGSRSHWMHTIQQDWPQIKQWREWSAAAQAAEIDRARLCIDFCVTTSAATTTQQTTEETIATLRRGLQVAQQLNDSSAEGEILYMLGLNHLRLQQLEEARTYADSLMICGARQEDSRMLGRARYLRACVSHSCGDFGEAKTQYGHSQEMLEAGDPQDMVAVWAGFGHVAYFQGDYQACLEYHNKSMELARLLDDEPNVAVAHLSLAGVCLQLKDLSQAASHAEETLRIARKLRFLPLIPHSLTMLANVNRQLGRLEDARGYYEEVLEVTRGTLSPDSIVSALTGLGRVYVLKGDEESAIKHLSDALTIANESNISFRIPPLAEELAYIYLKHGDLTYTRRYLGDLVTSAQALDTVRFYAKTIFVAALLWYEEGRIEQAAQWVGLLEQHEQHLDTSRFAKFRNTLKHKLGEVHYLKSSTAGQMLVLKDVLQILADELTRSASNSSTSGLTVQADEY